MSGAVVVIILLSHQGFWIGGDQNDIGLQWAARGGQPAADLRWELELGGTRVAWGNTAMLPDPGTTEIRLTPPEVRVPVTMRWKYTLTAHAGGKELDHGETPIEIFPSSLLDGLNRRIGRSRIAVWDNGEGLSGALDQAKAAYTRVTNLSKLAFLRPQAVLVGSDMLDDSPFTAGPLIELAHAGASVMFFYQGRSDTVDGYDLVRRNAPVRLEWLADHALLRGMDATMLKSIAGAAESFLPVRLPADEPALAIAAWPREVPGTAPVSIDALLVSKAVGKGRIVICQLPLTEWTKDPRAQLLLVNAMDYLLSPPEPTPRPSQRASTRPAGPPPPASVLLLPGGQL